MPLSKHIASVVKGLEFNLIVFGESDWGPEVRTRLIDESIAVLDEIILDPVFCFTLRIAYEAHNSPESPLQLFISGGKPLLSFLEKERVLLAGADFRDEHITQLIEETKRVVEAGLKGFAKPEEVFQAVIRMKFALLEAREAEKKTDWYKVARKLTFSLGGAALVGLNATGWAASTGITGPLSALSSAVGGAILGETAKDIVELLGG